MTIYQKLIKHFGGIQQTAEALDISYKTVWAWSKGTRNPKASTCAVIETKTKGKFTCKQLCAAK